MKKMRSEAEWRVLFEERERSALSVKAYCRTKGVNANMFYRKKKSLCKTAGGFVRMSVGLEKGTAIEIALGGVTIGVRGGFAERELVRVLRCVREVLDA